MSYLKHTIGSKGLVMACTILVALMLTAPVGAQNPTGIPQAEPEIAIGELAGTAFIVTPWISDYEAAVLRVAGPENYALTKRFEGYAPITADLLAEGELFTDDREQEAALTVLPRGQYNYEVVFSGAEGRRVHGGNFQVR